MAADRLNNILTEIIEDTDVLDISEFLNYAWRRWRNEMVFASSCGAEDQVLFDLLYGVSPEFQVFTLDTGRLPQETYDVIEETRRHYNKQVEIVFPDSSEVQLMVAQNGPNLFYNSIENRHQCCYVRKVAPLKRHLTGYKVWLTGQRRSQSTTRAEIHRVEWDKNNGIIKLNPLFDWSREQVWEYIKEHNIPYNKLHDMGYPSIGCAPCTRAVAKGEDDRAGRWWWEQPEQKECGLHVENGKLVRTRKGTTDGQPR